MQIKTHLHLADIIYANFEDELNKFFFKIGSALPDILPTMRFRSHSMSKSNDYLQERIKTLIEKKSQRRYRLSIHLGIISHFLSDFCCKPHMEGYTGSLVDHRKYEVNLSCFHGKYHEDFSASIDKATQVIAQVLKGNIIMAEVT